MGTSLSKDEEVVEKLLQTILCNKEPRYDPATLRGLLEWSKARDLIPETSAAFDLSTWERVGQKLWEELSRGSKEVKKFPTTWRLLVDALQDTKIERQVSLTAQAVLGGVGGFGAAAAGGKTSVEQLVFGAATALVPAAAKRAGQQPVEQGKVNIVAEKAGAEPSIPPGTEPAPCAAVPLPSASLLSMATQTNSTPAPSTEHAQMATTSGATASAPSTVTAVTSAHVLGPVPAAASSTVAAVDEAPATNFTHALRIAPGPKRLPSQSWKKDTKSKLRVKKKILPPLRSSGSSSSSEEEEEEEERSAARGKTSVSDSTKTQLDSLVKRIQALESKPTETQPSSPKPASSDPSVLPAMPMLPPGLPFSRTPGGGIPTAEVSALPGGEVGGGGHNPVLKWKGILRDALIEGNFEPAGVTAYPVFVDGAGNKTWEALDWKIIKEAKAAVSQYGLKSSYTQSIIQHLFTANLLTPYDTRMIVNTLLTPSQQLQFFNKWTSHCAAVAAQPRQQGDPLNGVTSQMLMGTGPFERADWQTQFISEVLQTSQDLAFKSLLAVKDEKSGPPCTMVRQGPTESYSKFVDRLHQAIHADPDMDSNMKAKFLDMLAYDNANEKTKKVLSTLPRGAGTAQLLEAANRMIEQDKAAYIATAVGAAVQPLIQNQGEGIETEKAESSYS